MRCSVDDTLLNEAAAVLGTTSPEETVEVSLRRTIGELQRGATLRALRDRLRTPPDEAELARRREAGQAMDRVRVKVGRDFDTAREVRTLRERVEQGLQPDTDDHG